VDVVHAKGATFFCQLWHVGRVSHTGMYVVVFPQTMAFNCEIAIMLQTFIFRNMRENIAKVVSIVVVIPLRRPQNWE
jgi:2,4-dienoyl-CoA reductase-like NADH-dependent reductase (Old Yellow Enzyme family)